MGKIVKDRIIYGGTPYLSAETGDVLSVDESGNVVGIDPAELDTKVTQIDSSADARYRILLSNSASSTTEVAEVKKSDYLRFNPNIGSLTLGSGCTASGRWSYAQGYDSHASGYLSHAEGYSNASGQCSHAEGSSTAVGECSHAEGDGTYASHLGQHVFGAYNIPDNSNSPSDQKGNYIEIVGNGGDIDPQTIEFIYSNARTLDWDGNEVLAGKLTLGAAPTANMDATTKLYVDTGLSGKVDKAGDTMTGQLVILGTAASKPLMTRGIVGSNGSGSDGELHLQYGNSTDDSILFGNTGGGYITSNGTLYSGWSGGLQLPRVSKDCNFRPGTNKINVEEYQNDSANLPSAHWYHIYTSEGSDSNYACQLALGMTTDAAYYRRYNNGTWTSWQSIINTNTTYSIATGDNNGQIKVTPSSGSAYNVSVKGLGSAAYVNADTAASNNTMAKRTANGYIYATYFNQSSGAETPTTSSYAFYCNSDGFLRKSSMANMRSALGLGSLATLSSISNYITVGSVSYDNFSISANNSAQTGNVATTKSGWTALGIIGVSLANASSSGTLYSWCSVYQYAMNSSKQVYAQVRNHYTGGAAKIKVQWFILYIK